MCADATRTATRLPKHAGISIRWQSGSRSVSMPVLTVIPRVMLISTVRIGGIHVKEQVDNAQMPSRY